MSPLGCKPGGSFVAGPANCVATLPREQRCRPANRNLPGILHSFQGGKKIPEWLGGSLFTDSRNSLGCELLLRPARLALHRQAFAFPAAQPAVSQANCGMNEEFSLYLGGRTAGESASTFTSGMAVALQCAVLSLQSSMQLRSLCPCNAGRTTQQPSLRDLSSFSLALLPSRSLLRARRGSRPCARAP